MCLGHFQIQFLWTLELDQFACSVREADGPSQASQWRKIPVKQSVEEWGRAESILAVCKLSPNIKQREMCECKSLVFC